MKVQKRDSHREAELTEKRKERGEKEPQTMEICIPTPLSSVTL
jgi:hypothetical protein